MHCFLPDKPSEADLLAAKAALVGSSAPPAPLLVIGGDATERRDLFRTLASAVGLRIVTASVSGLAELGDRTTQLASIISSAGHSAPSDTAAAGVILIIEGLEALHVESMPDLSSYEWHREHRLAAQRALAAFLQTGIEQHGLLSIPWLKEPLWIVCCQAEGTPGWTHSRSGVLGEGLIPELADALQERVRLGPPSVRTMVAMLRKVFEEQATGRGDVESLMREVAVTVPDATLWTAAHIAQNRNESVRFARVVIETAIRRSLCRCDERSSSSGIVISPDDLEFT